MRAAARFCTSAVTYGLADLGPELGQARSLDDLSPLPRAIVGALLSADVLIVGSPVYKGSYPGLFEHLFDLIDPSALLGKPVLLTATGGGDKHALVIEHQLRPLFGFFEAATLATGVYASTADFSDGVPSSASLLARIDRAVDQFQPWLGRTPPPKQPDPDPLHPQPKPIPPYRVNRSMPESKCQMTKHETFTAAILPQDVVSVSPRIGAEILNIPLSGDLSALG